MSNIISNDLSTFEKKLPLSIEPILTTCAVLQDASAPAQFQLAFSRNKDQGEPTILKWPLESKLVGQKSFMATFNSVFV